MDPEGQLASAMRLFQQQQYPQAESQFRGLIDSATPSSVRAKAQAGAGLVRFALHDLPGAESLLKASLQTAPNADAYYGIGRVAEQRNDRDLAIQCYGGALAINPQHRAAAQRLQRLRAGTPPASAPPDNVEKPKIIVRSRQPDEAQQSLLMILRNDGSPISVATISLIERIHEVHYPKRRAYPLALMMLIVPILVSIFFLSV